MPGLHRHVQPSPCCSPGLLIAAAPHCRAEALGYVGFSNFGTAATWRVDLPGPGVEPVSPALAGRFLPTGPPGKSYAFML